MTLPSSGVLTFQMILNELGRNGPLTLNDADARSLCGIPSGIVHLSDFYGKSVLPSQLDYAWEAPGTYQFVMPNGVNKFAYHIIGGSGGGGGGGGAGEYQWTPSASGGGGGGGGRGEEKFGIFEIAPGTPLTIVIGNGGAGGAGGVGDWSGARYNGYSGANGGNGESSFIHGVVGASGGAGGYGGQGAEGDNPWFQARGGNGGAGWPAGNAGEYAHIPNRASMAQQGDGIYTNTAQGNGGSAHNRAGSGGNGGNWITSIEGYTPPERIGQNGIGGAGGYVRIILMRDTNIGVPYSGYTGENGSVAWPLEPYNAPASTWESSGGS